MSNRDVFRILDIALAVSVLIFIAAVVWAITRWPAIDSLK